MIQTIILDIEGTITNPRGFSTTSVKSLQIKLQTLENHGSVIILCSGRDMRYIKDFKDRWGLLSSSPIIAENGCVIFDGNRDLITFNPSDFTPSKIQDKILKSDILEFAEFDPAKEHMVTIYPKGFVAGLEARLEDVPKIVEYTRTLLTDFDLTITHSSCSLDIQPQGVDKLHGLKALIKHNPNIQLDQTLYVGDSRNDLEIGKFICESGGLFCVPENAIEELKSIANYTANKPYDEGVLEILEKYIN